MTLKEKIAQATKLVQNYTDLQKKDSQVKQYANLLSRIEELKSVAQNTAQSFAVLCRNPHSNFTQFQPLATNELLEIKKTLLEGAFSTTRINRVKEILAEQEATLQVDWKNYVKELSSSMENTLGLLSSLQENPARIREITAEVSQLRMQWPVSDIHLELLGAAITAGQKILADLSLDSEIEEFMVKLIQQEARLSDLNSRIIDWLNVNNMGKYLAISIVRQ